MGRNEILEQIASVLEMEDFELSNYFPEIINNDSSKTNPKRATASYVQKVFQLLFFKMY